MRSLADGIGGNKGCLYGCSPHEVCTLLEPAGHKVEIARVVYAFKDMEDVGLLLRAHKSRTPKRRVTKDVGYLFGRDYFFPVLSQGICTDDVARCVQGQGGRRKPAGLAQFKVQDVFHEVQGNPCYIYREFL